MFQKLTISSSLGKKRNLQHFPPLPTCADLQTGMCAPVQAHTRKSSPATRIFVLHQHTSTGLQQDTFVFCFLPSPTAAEGGRYRNRPKRAHKKTNNAFENVTAFVLHHNARNNSRAACVNLFLTFRVDCCWGRKTTICCFV